jgi:hypothetical protein
MTLNSYGKTSSSWPTDCGKPRRVEVKAGARCAQVALLNPTSARCAHLAPVARGQGRKGCRKGLGSRPAAERKRRALYEEGVTNDK